MLFPHRKTKILGVVQTLPAVPIVCCGQENSKELLVSNLHWNSEAVISNRSRGMPQAQSKMNLTVKVTRSRQKVSAPSFPVLLLELSLESRAQTWEAWSFPISDHPGLVESSHLKWCNQDNPWDLVDFKVGWQED